MWHRFLRAAKALCVAGAAAGLALVAASIPSHAAAAQVSAAPSPASATPQSQTLHIIGTKVINGITYPEIYVPGASRASTPAIPAAAGPSLLINFHSDKVAEVFHSSTANGANVDQWTSNGTATQKWYFDIAYSDQVGNPVGNIVNANSGKCFEVYNWAAGNGSNVDQWACAPLSQRHSNQLWDLDSPLIVAVGASVERNLTVVAEVHAWSTANQGNVDIWQFLAGANQEWDYAF